MAEFTMSRPGPAPKPTLLRILSGNPGGRPLNENEPQPEGDLYTPPEWLTDAQKAIWHYAIDNAPKGLLRRLDLSILTAWVVAEDFHADAAQQVAKYGKVVKSPDGYPIQSPYMAIVNRQALIKMKAANELGFSPTSRSKIQVSPKAPQNPFSKNGRRA